MTPNPRTVSRRLLTRKEFIPATTLNTLAATWIQFMVKDWIGHGTGDLSRAFKPPLEPDDIWPEPELVIPATIADPTRTDDKSFPPTFVNEHSAWWDGSVIYGDSLDQQKLLRSGTGGKLNVSNRLPALLTDPDIDPSVDPARIPGFWTGLAMMGVLFCLEHNSICDALAAENPHWDDEELFQRARLVLAALIAKIHTVEWTPGIISHPTTVDRTARQLVRARRSEDPRHLRPHQLQGPDQRRHREHSGPLRRAVLADRGVLDRLPHAPLDSRRLRDPGLAHRQGRGPVHAARIERRGGQGGAGRG